MTNVDGCLPARDVAAYLDQLVELARQASDRGDATEQAVVLAELQRHGERAMHLAVAHARRHGASWRDLAAALDTPVTTLRRRYADADGAAVAQAPDDGRPQGRASPVPEAGRDEFIGREQELADLRRLLTRSRLVSVTGPGGVGKSRLVIELIPHLHRTYRAGLWWVELAPVPDASSVPGAVAAVVEDGGHPRRGLADACAAGAALLVLDNCEHVIAGCADLVAQLQRDHPRLRVVTTSREALRVPGESVFPVAPLAVPEGGTASESEIRGASAVRLFLDRARHLAPDTAVADDLPLLALLCTRLDGLPLAIELAAHQLRVLPPERLIERLDERLDDRLAVLVGGARDGFGRHRSLRAAIEWSYELLTGTEQAVFRRLAVLPGGFEETTAAVVCADTGAGADLWATVTALVDKSMLVADPLTPGRVRMLESLRAYGCEQLADAGEHAATNDRLLGWLSGLCGELPDHHVVTGMISVLHREQHNLRYAVEVARQIGDPRYLRLAMLLGAYLNGVRQVGQARAVLETALAGHDEPSAEAVLAYTELAFAYGRAGDRAAGRTYAEQAHRMAEQLDSPHLRLIAMRGQVSTAADDPEFVKLVGEELRLLRELGPADRIPLALNGLACGLLALGRYEEAQPAIDEALSLRGDGYAAALHTAGTLATLRGELDRADGYFRAAVGKRPLDADHHPYVLEGMALLAVRREQPERAIRLLAAAGTARSVIDTTPPGYWLRLLDEAATMARTRLGAARAGAAWATGSTLSADQATAYALHDEWPRSAPAAAGRTLSGRELQVAALVAEGLTNAQIAGRLGVSARTVANHLEHLRRKLDLPTRAHVTAWATRQRPR